MRLYYRGSDAIVTSEHFVHRTPAATTTYRVRDLRNIGVTEAEPQSSNLPQLIIGALVLAGVGWAVVRGTPLYAIALLSLATFAVAAGSLFRRTKQKHLVLFGVYRGQPVSLYSSPDARVFNQVKRAVQRAVEERDEPAFEEPSAA
jgi:hypothetical protein